MPAPNAPHFSDSSIVLAKDSKVPAELVIAALYRSKLYCPPTKTVQTMLSLDGTPLEIYIIYDGEESVKIWSGGTVLEDIMVDTPVKDTLTPLPIVKCENGDRSGYTLTTGKHYYLLETIASITLGRHVFPEYKVVIDDFLNIGQYHASRFSSDAL